MKKTSAGADAAIDQAASEWLMRRDTERSSADERELADWLAADPRHREAYARLDRTWAVFDRAEIKGAANTIVTRLQVRARHRRRRRLQVLASVGVVAAALWFAYRPWTGAGPLPADAADAALAFEPIRKLPDGSIVELNDGAEIAVQYETTIRRVRLLRGEAHFRVEKDAARPFLVQAGGVDVVAVGTAFTVQVAPQNVEVVVTEGRVSVDRSSESEIVRPAAVPPVVEPTRVDAGNRVFVDRTAPAAQPLQLQLLTEAEINERLAWRIPRLEFGGVEMAQAIALMNRCNRMQILLGDASIGRLRVSGVFRSDNPEGFVRMVEATFELISERRGENEVILRQR